MDTRVTAYANILGEWIKLEDTDLICGCPSFSLFYKQNMNNHSFVDATIKGINYRLHVSQLQFII